MLNLPSLVAAARPGETLRLPAGRIVLREPLVLDKPLTLKGAGPSKTVLVGSLICASPKLRIESLAVDRRDKAPGDGVLVRSGRVELQDVHVRGGRGKKKGDLSTGAGVLLTGSAEALLRRCVTESNASAGVNARGRSRLRAEDCVSRKNANGFDVEDDAYGELVRCRAEANGNVAVAFSGRARGRVEGGSTRGSSNGVFVGGRASARLDGIDISGSRWPGVYAGGRAQLEIVNAGVSKTGRSGVYVEGSAAATIEDCEVREAGVNGIDIRGRATAAVKGNVCEGAEELGIWVDDQASAKVVGNTARGQSWSGIGTGSRGKVELAENLCLDNKEYGLVVVGRAAPLVRANQARGNGLGGLWVRGDAAPRVARNVFESNKGPGVKIVEKARGVYEGNRCLKNAPAGIAVEDESAPELIENVCEANEEYGLRYGESGAGRARGNALSRNAYGVGVYDEARPKLERNLVSRNSDEGIKVENASPLLENNLVEKNGGHGIEIGADSGAVARGNRSVANLVGFHCWGGCSPRLERNTCMDNEGEGFSFDSDVDGVHPRATMVGNVSKNNGEDDGIGPRLSVEQLRKALAGTPAAALARPAWKPSTKEGEGLSKFGGVPRLDPGEAWPRCGGCRKPLPLLLQLDLSTLPKPHRAKGLLQAFCCRFDKSPCQDGEGYYIVRVRSPKGADARPEGKPWPARRIVGWRESGELPRWMELKPRSLAKAIGARGLKYFDGNDDVGEGPNANAQSGDKLGGWASWVQGAAAPRCPRCRNGMRPLLQIDSDENIPFEWGDYGTAWIFRCDAHLEALAFDWQCL